MTEPAQGLPDGLIEVEWTLREMSRGGATRQPPSSRLEPVLRISEGGQLSGTDGCNYLTAPVELRGRRLAVGSMKTTAVRCPDLIEVTETIRSVLANTVDWEMHGSLLQLTAETGAKLVYERRASIFPSDRPGYPRPNVVLEGHQGRGDYRLSYQTAAGRLTLVMESRDAAGFPWDFCSRGLELTWAGPEPNPMACGTGTVDGNRFVVGIVSRRVAHLDFHDIDANSQVEILTYAMGDTPLQAFCGFVREASRGSQLLAYDDKQAVLGPPYEPYWRLPGDPL